MRATNERLSRALVVLAALAIAGTPASGQKTKVDEDRFAAALFAPDLVMQHSRAIQLTSEQRTRITAAIQELQGKAVALQFQLLEEAQSALELLEQPRVDETRALAAINRVLDIEQEVKATQTALLIRIKNTLTAEQQARLRELRDQRHPDAGQRHPGPRQQESQR